MLTNCTLPGESSAGSLVEEKSVGPMCDERVESVALQECVSTPSGPEPDDLPSHPRIGIIGVAGKYGQWLKRFFETVMKCEVIGADPIDSNLGARDNRAVVSRSDVVVFSVPMDKTAEIIGDLIEVSTEGQLWMDVTSIKSEPCKAMLKSRAEVIGFHPMIGPMVESWKGQPVVVCPLRCQRWLDWALDLLRKSGAKKVVSSPRAHDQHMAFVQALPHALMLTMASVLRTTGVNVSECLELAPPPFRLAWSIIARMLIQKNADLYADVQLANRRYSIPVLSAVLSEASSLTEAVRAGDREGFKRVYEDAVTFFGVDNLESGAQLFDQLVRIMADLGDENRITLQAKVDRPGLLYALLKYFENPGINLTSLHSFKSPDGYFFQIGLEKRRASSEVTAALVELEEEMGDYVKILPF